MSYVSYLSWHNISITYVSYPSPNMTGMTGMTPTLRPSKMSSADMHLWHPTARIAIHLFGSIEAGLRGGIWQTRRCLNSGCYPASQNADCGTHTNRPNN